MCWCEPAFCHFCVQQVCHSGKSCSYYLVADVSGVGSYNSSKIIACLYEGQEVGGGQIYKNFEKEFGDKIGEVFVIGGIYARSRGGRSGSSSA